VAAAPEWAAASGSEEQRTTPKTPQQRSTELTRGARGASVLKEIHAERDTEHARKRSPVLSADAGAGRDATRSRSLSPGVATPPKMPPRETTHTRAPRRVP
jgi:hypothetical protein